MTRRLSLGGSDLPPLSPPRVHISPNNENGLSAVAPCQSLLDQDAPLQPSLVSAVSSTRSDVGEEEQEMHVVKNRLLLAETRCESPQAKMSVPVSTFLPSSISKGNALLVDFPTGERKPIRATTSVGNLLVDFSTANHPPPSD